MTNFFLFFTTKSLLSSEHLDDNFIEEYVDEDDFVLPRDYFEKLETKKFSASLQLDIFWYLGKIYAVNI